MHAKPACEGSLLLCINGIFAKAALVNCMRNCSSCRQQHPQLTSMHRITVDFRGMQRHTGEQWSLTHVTTGRGTGWARRTSCCACPFTRCTTSGVQHSSARMTLACGALWGSATKTTSCSLWTRTRWRWPPSGATVGLCRTEIGKALRCTSWSVYSLACLLAYLLVWLAGYPLD